MKRAGILKETVDKYRRLIQGKSTWTESDIRGFLKLINGLRFCDNDRNPERHAAIQGLLELWEDRGMGPGRREWPITAEQSRKGIEYLRKRYFKLNGAPRAKCAQLGIGAGERNAIRNFKRHAFVGLHNVGTYSPFYQPVYRLYAKDGRYFDYSPGHWREIIIVEGVKSPSVCDEPSPPVAKRAARAKPVLKPSISSTGLAWPTLLPGGRP